MWVVVYSKKIRAALLNPVNGRPSNIYNGVGVNETTVPCRTNPARVSKNTVKFMLFVYDGVIHDARWEVFGDPVAIAVASWCRIQVMGKQLSDLAHLVTPERAAMDLGIVDELDIRAGCMASIGAFAAALDDYFQRSQDPV